MNRTNAYRFKYLNTCVIQTKYPMYIDLMCSGQSRFTISTKLKRVHTLTRLDVLVSQLQQVRTKINYSNLQHTLYCVHFSLISLSFSLISNSCENGNYFILKAFLLLLDFGFCFGRNKEFCWYCTTTYVLKMKKSLIIPCY